MVFIGSSTALIMQRVMHCTCGPGPQTLPTCINEAAGGVLAAKWQPWLLGDHLERFARPCAAGSPLVGNPHHSCHCRRVYPAINVGIVARESVFLSPLGKPLCNAAVSTDSILVLNPVRLLHLSIHWSLTNPWPPSYPDPPSPQFTSCTPLHQYLADVDACLTTPCGKNMDCFDLPRPALSGVTGRQCKCFPGTTYVDDLMGCSGKQVASSARAWSVMSCTRRVVASPLLVRQVSKLMQGPYKRSHQSTSAPSVSSRAGASSFAMQESACSSVLFPLTFQVVMFLFLSSMQTPLKHR